MQAILDKGFLKLAAFATGLVFVVLFAIFVTLYTNAHEAIVEYGFSFLTNSVWAPNKEIFGGFAAIYGTLVSTFIAMLVSVPVAIGIAIFLLEIAHPALKSIIGVSVELLAAIPSVIYGMWGLFYFVPIVQDSIGGNGLGLFTGGIILSVMILPFISSITKDAMATTPDILKESAYALGATKFDVIKDVVIPYAKAGIIGSFILALGRAIGETMAVTFVVGNVHKAGSIFDAATSIPVTLANEFNEAAPGLHASSLYYLAFVLFIISFFIISVAKFYFLKKLRTKS